MAEQRKVLFVTICSNNKKTGGSAGYDRSRSIAACLDASLGAELLDGRARVLEVIKKGGKTRDGKRIADLSRNRTLVKGPDLGGDSENGRYLPAEQRYRGSFYSQLGSDAHPLLSAGPASAVILSGLYGVLLPDEPIQDYSCHLNDHPSIRNVWSGSNLATEVLLRLVRNQGIEKIIDFTALHSYRYLLDWCRIRASVPGGVLHLFGEQTRGESLLTPLGALARSLLVERTEQELLRLENGQFLKTETERIYCHSGDHPPQKLPQGLQDEVNLFDACDEVVRMARDVRRQLHALDPAFEDKGMPSRIDRLAAERGIPSEVAQAMKDIMKWRNEIEHQYSFTALQIPIDWLRKRYEIARRHS